MALRATWRGYIKIGFVTFPVRLYTAVSGSGRISLNQIHKDCGLRLRQEMTCPEHGKVPREEVQKGYEVAEGKYIVIDEADMEAVAPETGKTLEIVAFVPASDIDPIWLASSYYMAPDGPVAEDGFTTMRDAMAKAKCVGVGRIILQGRERPLVIRPIGSGIALQTLHCVDEVKSPEPHFEGVPDKAPSQAIVNLGKRLISSMSGTFDPQSFTDRYQEALTDLIKAKAAGRKVEAAKRHAADEHLPVEEAMKKTIESGKK